MSEISWLSVVGRKANIECRALRGRHEAVNHCGIEAAGADTVGYLAHTYMMGISWAGFDDLTSNGDRRFSKNVEDSTNFYGAS